MPETSSEFHAQLRDFIDTKTKPVGALGRIETLAEQVALLQGTLRPRMERCGLTIFAADHGIAAEGVSAFPSTVTTQMVQNFLTGGAAANVFAKTTGAYLRVVDAGIATPVAHPNLLVHSMGRGTANSLREPAMTAEVLDATLEAGRTLGREWVFDAVAFGEMGIGNTATSALLIHKITGKPLFSLVGPGTGLDDDGLARKRRVLEAAAGRTRRLSLMDTLREYGGFEIVMMAGAMEAAAQAGRLVLVDGYIATTAALIATKLSPETRAAMVFAHRSAEPGHAAALEALEARPLLDLGMRLGEGTGALLAWPLVQAAVGMLNDMASFADAGVSGAL